MTRGGSSLNSNASIYDCAPILLFDRFPWSDRSSVIAALRDVFSGRKWAFGGAYLFWSQPPEGGGDGEVLYCGEAEDLLQRQCQHLAGPAGVGNKFRQLCAYFAEQPLCCGLALLVIPPRELPWLSPPDDNPFLEERAAKEAGEALEALLLRAAINVQGKMPRFNKRSDASRYCHDVDGVRFQSLLRFLLGHPDPDDGLPNFLDSLRAREGR
jgi:hypothetical protein